MLHNQSALLPRPSLWLNSPGSLDDMCEWPREIFVQGGTKARQCHPLTIGLSEVVDAAQDVPYVRRKHHMKHWDIVQAPHQQRLFCTIRREESEEPVQQLVHDDGEAVHVRRGGVWLLEEHLWGLMSGAPKQRGRESV